MSWFHSIICFDTPTPGLRKDPHLGNTVARPLYGESNHDVPEHGHRRGPRGHGHARLQRPKAERGCQGDGQSGRVGIHQGQEWRRIQTQVGQKAAMVQPVKFIETAASLRAHQLHRSSFRWSDRDFKKNIEVIVTIYWFHTTSKQSMKSDTNMDEAKNYMVCLLSKLYKTSLSSNEEQRNFVIQMWSS